MKPKIKGAAYPRIHLCLEFSNILINIHNRNWECVAVVHWLFHEWWLLKELFVPSRVYRRILLSKSSSKHLIFTLLEQLNTNLQGISVPPHSCLQWRLWSVTSAHIFLPRAIKYHKVREYLRGKWATISLVLTTFTANLSASLPSSWSARSFYPVVGFQTTL